MIWCGSDIHGKVEDVLKGDGSYDDGFYDDGFYDDGFYDDGFYNDGDKLN